MAISAKADMEAKLMYELHFEEIQEHIINIKDEIELIEEDLQYRKENEEDQETVDFLEIKLTGLKMKLTELYKQL
jgi:hypothetical protein